MRVVLARHGHTRWNEENRCLGHTDVPLSARGRQEARALAEALEGEPFARFHASDLARAVETAAAVAGHPGRIRRHWGLRELHQGELEGLAIRSMFASHPELGERWRADPTDVRLPGGESMRMLQERVVAAFEEATAEPWRGSLLVVSHNLALSSLLAHVAGTPLAGFSEWYHLPGGYTVLERSGGAWRVRAHNVSGHLTGLSGAGAP